MEFKKSFKRLGVTQLVRKITGKERKEKRLFSNAQNTRYSLYERDFRNGNMRKFLENYYNKYGGGENYSERIYDASKRYFEKIGFGKEHARMLAWHTEAGCIELRKRHELSMDPAKMNYSQIVRNMEGVAEEYIEKHGGAEKAYEKLRESGFKEKEAKTLARNIQAECKRILWINAEAEKYFKKHIGKINRPEFLQEIFEDARRDLAESGQFSNKGAKMFASRISARCAMLQDAKMGGK